MKRIKLVTQESSVICVKELLEIGGGEITLYREGCTNLIHKRTKGNLGGKAVYLPSLDTGWEWIIGIDDYGATCLVAGRIEE